MTWTSPSGMTASEAARLRGEHGTVTSRRPPRPASSTASTALVAPPVTWTSDRDIRGAAPGRGRYRCPLRGCPVVAETEAALPVLVEHVRVHRAEDDPPRARVAFSYPVPPLEPCHFQVHGVEHLVVGAGLATATGSALGPAAAPDLTRTDARRAIVTALLADSQRSNRAVAAAAGSDHTTTRVVRHEMEQAGMIAPFRARSVRLTHAPSMARQLAIVELLADPCRANAVIGAVIGTHHSWICLIRHELERSGAIPVWRGRWPDRLVVPGWIV